MLALPQYHHLCRRTNTPSIIFKRQQQFCLSLDNCIEYHLVKSSPLNQLNDMVLQIVCKISGCCFFVNNRRCDAQVRIGSNHFWARVARQIAPLGISSTFIHRVTGRFAFTQPSRHQSQIHITCQHPNGSAWRGRCLGHTLVPCGCTRRLSMPTQDIW